MLSDKNAKSGSMSKLIRALAILFRLQRSVASGAAPVAPAPNVAPTLVKRVSVAAVQSLDTSLSSSYRKTSTVMLRVNVPSSGVVIDDGSSWGQAVPKSSAIVFKQV